MNRHGEPKVIMYHGIPSDGVRGLDSREVGAEIYDLPVSEFRKQMQWIKKKGYHVGNTSDSLKGNLRRLVLTFDDGEMNNYTEAFPILREFGFFAYFFIIVKRVGKPGYMGWSEIRKLHEAGMVIGSHGLSHEILTNLIDTQIEEEFHASKINLERNLDIKIDSVSIPRGFCDDRVIEKAYNAGYKEIFISDRPRNLSLGCYSRIAVKGTWRIKRFEQAMNGIVPFNEKVKNQIKHLAKFILREGGYNRLRNLVIKLLR